MNETVQLEQRDMNWDDNPDGYITVRQRPADGWWVGDYITFFPVDPNYSEEYMQQHENTSAWAFVDREHAIKFAELWAEEIDLPFALPNS